MGIRYIHRCPTRISDNDLGFFRDILEAALFYHSIVLMLVTDLSLFNFCPNWQFMFYLYIQNYTDQMDLCFFLETLPGVTSGNMFATCYPRNTWEICVQLSPEEQIGGETLLCQDLFIKMLRLRSPDWYVERRVCRDSFYSFGRSGIVFSCETNTWNTKIILCILKTANSLVST